MAVKEFAPAGAPGDSVVLAGTNLSQVLVTASPDVGTLTYNSAAALGRGSVGVYSEGLTASSTAAASIDNTSAVAGADRVYGLWPEYPTGTALVEFLRLRSSAGNLIRFVIAPTQHASLAAGTVLVQNASGTTIATLGVVPLNTIHRYTLGAKPGASTTTGSGRAQIHSDADALLFEMTNANVVGGNIDALNLGTTQNVVRGSVGKVAATGTNLKFRWTRFAIDTGTDIPTISPVPKVVAPVLTGRFPLVWVGDSWR